jgi:hypothetical protein
MTDEQYRALHHAIKDLKVEISSLALAIRTMDRRLTTIEATLIRPTDPEYLPMGTDPLDDLLRIRQSLAPHSDTE